MRNLIMERHGAGVLKRSALNIRGGAGVFKHILEGKGYRTVLEIGTYRGCAAAEMSRYCERVVTIDLLHGKLEQSGEQFNRPAFWASLGITNIDMLLVTDNAERKALVDELDFDFAFIDGAHDASVREDFEIVKRCGRVLFHDYDPRGNPAQDHVFNFVNTLPKEQVQILDIFALWMAAPC